MRKSKCIRVFEPDTVTDKRSLREIFSEFGGVDTVETIEAPLPNAKSLFAFIHYKRLGDVKMAKQMMDKRANEPKIIIGVFLFAMETNKVLPSQTSSETSSLRTGLIIVELQSLPLTHWPTSNVETIKMQDNPMQEQVHKAGFLQVLRITQGAKQKGCAKKTKKQRQLIEDYKISSRSLRRLRSRSKSSLEGTEDNNTSITREPYSLPLPNYKGGEKP